jgi:hypothetical protein
MDISCTVYFLVCLDFLPAACSSEAEMTVGPILILLFIGIAAYAFKKLRFAVKKKRRRNYYRNVYLKSDAWQRKRYVVLKRDNWQCTYCGARPHKFTTKDTQERILEKNPSNG